MSFNLIKKIAPTSKTIGFILFLLSWCTYVNAHGNGDGHDDAKVTEAARQIELHAGCEKRIIHVDCGDSPSVAFFGAGIAVVFIQNDAIWFSRSLNLGQNFLPAVAVSKDKQKIYGHGENRPKIAIDGNNVYVSWTEKTEGAYTGNVKFARSLDMGETFQKEIIVNDDRQLTSHRFDSMILTELGRIYITWLDKRDKLIAKSKNQTYPGSAIYASYSDDQGKTFSKNVKLEDNSCECCRIAMTEAFERPDGSQEGAKEGSHNSIALLWRHIFAGGYRDHALAIFDGERLTTDIYRATRDNWKIDACPHHGPSLDASKKRVGYHMAWFSDGEQNQGLSYAFLDPTKGNKKQDEKNSVISMDSTSSAGHPQVLDTGTEVVYIWKVFDGEKTALKMRLSVNSGKAWQQENIVFTTAGKSDHPLLIKDNNGNAWISWHTNNDGLRLKRIEHVL